jgi:hypothetical protein
MKQRFLNQKLGKRISRKQDLQRVKISAQRAPQPRLPRAAK